MKIKVDVLHKRATVGRECVQNLTFTELRVLAHLVAARGTVIPRNHLLFLGWGIDEKLSTRRVDVTIGRLRTKLARHGVKIEAVSGEGYRL